MPDPAVALDQHPAESTTACMRRVASTRVGLLVRYGRLVNPDGLVHTVNQSSTRLGTGIVAQTRRANDDSLPVIIEYVDYRGRWFRDRQRHTTPVERHTSPGSMEPSAPRGGQGGES